MGVQAMQSGPALQRAPWLINVNGHNLVILNNFEQGNLSLYTRLLKLCS